jgi:cytochrome c-type biogenesis protein CcmF
MLHEGPARALAHLVNKNPRRYGGYVIHIGVVMIFIGVAASSLFRVEKQITLEQGDSFEVGRYTLKYDQIKISEDDHIASQAAAIEVFARGKQIDTLRPEKRFYKKQEQPTTEPAIRQTLREDLYVILGSYDQSSGLATLQVFINPMVSWLWLGGFVLVMGTVIAMYPNPAERRELALARAPQNIPDEVIAN